MHIVQKEEYSRNKAMNFYFRALVEYTLPWPFRSIACFIITIVTEPDVKFIEFHVISIFDKRIPLNLNCCLINVILKYLKLFCCFLLEFNSSLFTVIGFRECVQFHRNWSDIDIFCVLCDKLNLPLAYYKYQRKWLIKK